MNEPRHDDLENPPDYCTLRDDYWSIWDETAKLREELKDVRASEYKLGVMYDKLRADNERLRDALEAIVHGRATLQRGIEALSPPSPPRRGAEAGQTTRKEQ